MTPALHDRTRVDNAADFGRVAVMLGGHSAERDVSLKSGAAVLKALRSRNIDAEGWDPRDRSMAEFAAAGFDRVWIALHGAGGEDGAIQGALLWLGVPFTGSGVAASALAMDKVRCKYVFAASDIATPDYVVARHVSDASEAMNEIGLPLIVKPARQGSSIGMSRVERGEDLEAAVELALGYDSEALIERCIGGDEVTVAVLQGAALPSICIETPRPFYDYRAKYEACDTRYRCPASTDGQIETGYATRALAAFEALGCTGWGRVDFMHAPGEVPQVIEVNTVPGMTNHSLVPMAAQTAGIDFADLCWRILETSFLRNGRAQPMRAAANDA